MATYKVNDKVRVTLEGLQAHSRSIPAYMGYTRETMSWRHGLSKLHDEGAVGVVERVSGDNLTVQFPDHCYGVPDYMVEKVEENDG